MQIQKIQVYLWFDMQAEEAVNFYTSIFKNSRINRVSYYPEGAPGPAGMVMTMDFELEGQQFIALNGGPQYKFTEAISLLVNCESQAEVDRLWYTLTANGGEEQPCGWLKDKFGLSWQIIPEELGALMTDPDPEKAQRVMHAMLQMKKIDVQKLRDARDNL